MYAYIKGTVEETGENYVVLEAAGVGYLIYTNSYALNNLKNEWIAHFYLYLCSINNRVYSEIFFVHVCFCGIPQIIPSQNDLIISSFVHHKIKLLYES